MRLILAFVLLTHIATANEPTAEQWIAAGRLQSSQTIEWYEQNIKQNEDDLEAVQKRTKFREDSEPHFEVEGSPGIKYFCCENRVMRQVFMDMLKRRIMDLKSQRIRAYDWIAPSMVSIRLGAFGYLVNSDAHTKPSALLATPEKMAKAERLYKRLLENELIVSERMPATAEVFQVIDEDSFLARYRQDIVKIEGVSTVGVTDGAYYLFADPMYVTGTTTYAAAIGTNTVFVLKPISKETQAKLDAAITNEIRKAYRPRQWSDISGKFSIEAELADFDGKSVWLHKRDGSESKVPFSKLSKDDKEFVQEQLGAP